MHRDAYSIGFSYYIRDYYRAAVLNASPRVRLELRTAYMGVWHPT